MSFIIPLSSMDQLIDIHRKSNPSNLPRPQKTKNLKKVGALKLLFTLCSPIDYCIFFLGTLSSIICAFNTIAQEVLSGTAINHLFELKPSDNFPTTLYYDCLNYAIAAIIMAVVAYINFSTWFYLGRKLTIKYRKEYFKIILDQEMEWFDYENAFELSSRIENEINDISEALGYKFGYALHVLILFVSGIAYCMYLNSRMTLAICVVIPAICLILYISMNKDEDLSSMKEDLEKAGGMVEEVLYNRKIIDAYNTQKEEINNYSQYLKKAENACFRQIVLYAIFYGISELVSHLTEGGSLIFYSYVVADNKKNGKKDFFIGDLLQIINILIFQACMSLNEGMPCFKSINQACNAAKNFFYLREKNMIKLKNKEKRNKKIVYVTPNKEELLKDIIFKNVSFMYKSSPQNDFKIDNLNIVFKSKKLNTLIGESGCGKTTIISILQKLYPSYQGDISIGTTNISLIDTHYLRDFIGYVPQEPLLMNCSIKENILMGRTDFTDEEIMDVCKKTHLDRIIKKKDEGLNYIVGVRGGKLSGGEKQLLALTRALIRKPAILLLDEATSALDNKNMKKINELLKEISKEITVISIVHRLSSIEGSDWIILIKNGKDFSCGEHHELMEKCEYYKKLIEKDFVRKEKEILSQMKKKNMTIDNGTGNFDEKEEDEPLIQTKMLQFDTDDDMSTTPKIISVSPKPRKKEKLITSFSLLRKVYKIKPLGIIGIFVTSLLSGLLWPFSGSFFSIFSSIISKESTEINYLSIGIKYSLLYSALAILIGLIISTKTIAYESMGNFISNFIRRKIFKKLISINLSFFNKKENNPGSLFAKLSYEASKANYIVFTSIGVVLESLVAYLTCIFIGCYYNVSLTLITVTLSPFILLNFYLNFYIQNVKASNEKEVIQSSAEMVMECFYNIKTVKAYNFKSKVIKMFEEIVQGKNNENIKELKSLSNKVGLLWSLSSILIDVSLCVNFYFGTRLIIKEQISFDDFLCIFLSFQVGLYYISQGQFYMDDISQAYDSLKSVRNFLEIKNQNDVLHQKQGLIKPDSLSGKIEFDQVCFGFETGENQAQIIEILTNLSFVIYPGQRIGIVGDSGSGKSSIIQIIEGFYSTTSGSVLFDDIDSTQYNLASLRNRISYVEQEPSLFKKNVRENIRYGNSNIKDKEIDDIAKRLKIEYLLEKNEDIFDENGKLNFPVSGGEKQRIALARALLKKADIYLFDEPTTALDKTNEQEVVKVIKETISGKTAIFVAHRLSTVRDCDMIYVVKNGKFIEKGTHNELMKLNKKYAELYSISND